MVVGEEGMWRREGRRERVWFSHPRESVRHGRQQDWEVLRIEHDNVLIKVSTSKEKFKS